VVTLRREITGDGFHAVSAGNKGTGDMDYERMSNAKLYALLKERMPAVAETVGKVSDSNRDTVIAFLRYVQTNQDRPV
jgi:hypothetical protein